MLLAEEQQIVRRIEDEVVVGFDLVGSAQKGETVLEQPGEIAHGVGRLTGSSEDEEAVEDSRQPPALIDHDVEKPPTGVIDTAHRAEHLSRSGDGCQGVLDLVRHPSRHLTGGSHAIPHSVTVGLDAELGEILEVDDEADNGGLFILERVHREPETASSECSRVPSMRAMLWFLARLAMSPQLCSAERHDLFERFPDLTIDVGECREWRLPAGLM